jgi:uncharacterized membrane protein YgdD (TMEM256/DUF423 family)
MTPRLVLSAAALLMAAAVALGAFGAHALKARIAPDALAVWQTAVNYHAWHALALLGTGLLMLQMPEAGGLRLAAWLFGWASRCSRAVSTRSRSVRRRAPE